MSLLRPSALADTVSVLSLCEGEVPAKGKLNLELLTYVAESEFLRLGYGAPDRPLLPAVFRPLGIMAHPPVSHSLGLASLRLESRARDSDEECLVNEVPLAMFVSTSHVHDLYLPTKPAGDRYRLKLLNHGESAERFKFAVYGLVLVATKAN